MSELCQEVDLGTSKQNSVLAAPKRTALVCKEQLNPETIETQGGWKSPGRNIVKWCGYIPEKDDNPISVLLLVWY